MPQAHQMMSVVMESKNILVILTSSHWLINIHLLHLIHIEGECCLCLQMNISLRPVSCFAVLHTK